MLVRVDVVEVRQDVLQVLFGDYCSVRVRTVASMLVCEGEHVYADNVEG